jgi:hypothetical protein
MVTERQRQDGDDARTQRRLPQVVEEESRHFFALPFRLQLLSAWSSTIRWL